MIDWPQTESKFGVTEIINRPVVVCKCDGCGRERDVRVRVKSRVVNGQMAWHCPKCVGQREDVRKKLQDSTVRQWKKEDYQEERKKCSLKLWEDEKFRNKVIAGDLRYHHGDQPVEDMLRDKHLRRLASGHDWRIKAKPWKHRTVEQQERFRLASRRWWNKNREKINELRQQYRDRRRLPIYGTTVRRCLEYKFFNIYGAHKSRYKIAGTPEPFPTTQQLAEILEKQRVGDSIKCHHCQKVVDVFHFDHLDGIKGERINPQRIVISCPYCNISRAHQNVKKISLDGYFIQQISREEANKLLIDHFLGTTKKGMEIFGLYKDAKLIGVASYSVSAHPGVGESLGVKDDEVMDLERLYVKPSDRIQNLMSWFIRRSIKYLHKLHPKLKAVVSYCEHQFEGGSHIAAGMIPLTCTHREKIYVDQKGDLHRRAEIYRKARSLGLREEQYANQIGLLKMTLPPKTKFLVPLEK